MTRAAKTYRGMFIVPVQCDHLYFEIPEKELGRDMLLVGRYDRAAAADPDLPGGQFGEYGGDEFGERTLMWQRNGVRIMLHSPTFLVTVNPTPASAGVRACTTHCSPRAGGESTAPCRRFYALWLMFADRL